MDINRARLHKHIAAPVMAACSWLPDLIIAREAVRVGLAYLQFTGHTKLAKAECHTRAAEPVRLNKSSMENQLGNRKISNPVVPSVNSIDIIEKNQDAGTP